jgi:MFS family permease
VISGGLLIGATGLALIAAAHVASWEIYAFSLVSGAGLGLAFAAIPPQLLDTVPHAEMTSAGAINAIVFNIGTVLGGAVLGSVLAGSVVTETGFPSDHGYRLAYLIGAGTVIATTVVFLLLTHATRRPERGDRLTEHPETAQHRWVQPAAAEDAVSRDGCWRRADPVRAVRWEGSTSR